MDGRNGDLVVLQRRAVYVRPLLHGDQFPAQPKIGAALGGYAPVQLRRFKLNLVAQL